MAIVNGYATLAEIKGRLNLEAADTADDTKLEAVIAAASRMIDAETGREFFATTATRYFTADDFGFLVVDDLLSVTTLATDEDGSRTYATTWAATDYDLTPDNRTPVNIITPAPMGRFAFPSVRKGVKIVGSWGYCATGERPGAVREACLIQAVRLFKRADAPFGVMGTPELGVARIPKVDMDVSQLLHPFRRFILA